MEKLKLCPFCGGSPEMKTEFPEGYGGDIADVFVKCQNPDCGAEGAKISVMSDCARRVLDSAAALWNLRNGVAGATVRCGQWHSRKDPVYNVECSVCGYASPLKSNFCPHCGAKMDLGAEG